MKSKSLNECVALSPLRMAFGVSSQRLYGTFATNLTGPNASAGLFTAFNGQELIGNWSFPFTSPLDAMVQSATAAMIAKRP